ncbi:MAG: DEAD/DEAH box helicase, partial [Christensenellaceae bacterium]|nr:DEAD/DEAH box helicase [Christensenellaceae bacterium]
MHGTILFAPSGYQIDTGELDTFSELTPKELYLAAFNNETSDDPAHNFLLSIAKSFIDSVIHDPAINFTRVAQEIAPDTINQLLSILPFCLGMEYVTSDWISNIWDKFRDVFNNDLSEYKGSVEDYINEKNTSINVVGRVFFHLAENKDGTSPFAFIATYSKAALDNKTSHTKTISHIPLGQALKEFQNDPNGLLDLLSTVSKATDNSGFLSELVQSGELFHPLMFDSKDAYKFLCEVEFYESCGIICRVPNFWKKKRRTRLTVKIGPNGPSRLGASALIQFSPTIYLGDVELTKSEVEDILNYSSGLARIKGKWVEVNHDKLTKLLKQLDQIRNTEYSLAEGLQLMSGIKQLHKSDDDDIVEISNNEWLTDIIDKLKEPAKLSDIQTDTEFCGQLRHYQQLGLNWLDFNNKLGFGALLADDMGLGKTIQVLAYLDKLRADNYKTLLIVPASLIVNWNKEASKFAPLLRVSTLHGTSRDINIDDADLFITTYGMATRLDALKKITWDLIILDEAQAIKNANNKSTKIVKLIPSKSRIAMTGTPIENKLADLWSIFDFLNKGMLGNINEFTTFTTKLKNQPDKYTKLRDIVSPFILRRLKTDKNVISDLPDKIEITEYTTLTKKQVILYQSLVKDLQKKLESAKTGDSILQRNGIILSTLMKFKQLCNHPDHYSGLGEFNPAESGKFEALAEICETIRDKHESVLVFTQFREMCEPLHDYLSTIFGRDGLIIHGGVTPQQRGKIVEKFNSQYIPFMVLSLKAGGVGLNLTSANHVVHFDRWWNPSIENQATDRAFRIGQTKNVIVHKFVTTGTVEEKIDSILVDKQKLADDIITSNSG